MNTKAIFVFVILFLAGIFCFAEEGEPVLTFDSASFDFGEVGEGVLVTHEFTFTNTGKSLLEIEDVKPTCGCTVAGDFTKEVSPGGKGKISVTLNTKGYDGHVAKSIIVRSNVKAQAEVFLTLEGNVKSVISIQPRSLSLGQVDEKTSTPISGTYVITNSSKTPLKIIELVPQDSLTKASLETVKEGFEYKITITISPPFKERQNMEWLTVKTDSKDMPTLSLSYSYYAPPAIKVNPIAIMVSENALREGTEKEITIEGRPGYFMGVAEIKSSDPRITFTFKEVTKGRVFTLYVRIPPGYKLDEKNLPAISFRLKNVPNEPLYTIPIYKM